MPSPNPVFVYAACALVPAVSLWSALDFYGAVSAANRAGIDEYKISAQQQRFAPLAAAVPAGALLEYESDVPLSGNAGLVAFYSAQYSVAPCLLTPAGRAPSAGWVVGNFAQPPDVAATEARLNAKLERDFGGGLMLFRRGRR